VQGYWSRVAQLIWQGFPALPPKDPFGLYRDFARLGTTITACELDKHIAMQHAEQRLGEPRLVVNVVNKPDGTSN